MHLSLDVHSLTSQPLSEVVTLRDLVSVHSTPSFGKCRLSIPENDPVYLPRASDRQSTGHTSSKITPHFEIESVLLCFR